MHMLFFTHVILLEQFVALGYNWFCYKGHVIKVMLMGALKAIFNKSY